MRECFAGAALLAWIVCGHAAGANLLGNSTFALGQPVQTKTPDGQELYGSALNVAEWETEGPFRVFRDPEAGVSGIWCQALWSAAKWLTPGEYTFSIWLRSEGGERPARLAVAYNGRKRQPAFEATVKVTGQWQRFHLTGTIQAPGRYVCTLAKTGGELAASRAQLERGALSDYRPKAPVEGLARAVGNVNRLYLPGEELVLEAEFANQTAQPQVARVELIRQNLYLEPLGTETLTLTLAPHEKRLVPRRYAIAAPGAFRLLLRTGVGDTTAGTGMTWMVVPPPRNPAADDLEPPFFGVDSTINAANLEFAKRMGAKWWRTCGMNQNVEISSWCFVEPQPGKYVWRDDLVDLLRRHHFHIMANHLRTPDWASAAPPQALEKWGFKPARRDDWRSYIDAYTRHFQGRIACHEIWNEAAGSFFNGGTPEEFIDFTQIAVDAIRRNDPGAWVMGGANSIPSFSRHWTQVLLDSPLYRQLDYFDAHEGQIDKPFMDKLFAAGIKPGRIWLTETNPADISFHPLSEYDPREPFNPLLRFNLAAIGALSAFAKDFCGRSYYYISNNFVMGMARQDYDDIPLRDFDGAPTPATLGAAVLAAKLHHLRGLEALPAPAGVTAHLFGNAERCLAAVWAPYDQTLAATTLPGLPADVTVGDLTGNEVHPGPGACYSLRTPLFLEAAPGQAAALKATLARASATGILPPVLTAKLAALKRPVPEELRQAALVQASQVCRGFPYFVFAASGTSFAVFWQDPPGAAIRGGPVPAGITVQDWFGQELRFEPGAFKLPLPIPYLARLPGAPGALSAWLASLEVEGTVPLKLEAPRLATRALTVSLVNNLGQPLSGEVTVRAAAPELGMPEEPVHFRDLEPERVLFQTVAAGTTRYNEELATPGSTMLAFPLQGFPVDGPDLLPVAFLARAGEAEPLPYNFTIKVLRSLRTAQPKAIDGDLSDWQLKAPGTIATCTSSTRPYRGPRDGSGLVYSTWDDLHLYLAVQVRDDRFFRAYRAAMLWQSDCVEFFFNATPERPYPANPRQTDTFFHVFLGPAGDSLPDEVCVEAGGQFMKAEAMRMASRQTPEGYVVECAIPFAAFQYLGGQRQPYTVLGFDAAINDNDKGVGQGDGGNQTRRETILNWAGGPDDYRDVSKYGSLILLPDLEY